MPRILQVNYLGGFILTCQDGQQSQPVALTVPPTIKSQSLLAFLILQRDRAHSRENLIGMFWGDSPTHKARRSLSTALWHIRRCFPEHDPIESTSQVIQFCLDGRVELDTEKFKELINQGTITDFKKATSIYKGNFLDGFYDDWVISERFRLQSLFIESLAKLMLLQEEAGDFNNALLTGQQLLALDSLREDAHRLLMRVHCALGQRNSALEQYHTCQKQLREELDVEPTPETSELFQEIQSGAYTIGQVVPTVTESPVVRTTQIVRSPLDAVARLVLVGREKELTTLNEQWNGDCNMVMVTGEAGVGKTCLLETFAETMNAQGTRVLWGRCYEFERLLPYQPITEALRHSFAGSTTETIDRFPKWVITELGRLLPEMGEDRTEHNRYPSTSNDQEQMRLFEGIHHYLSGLTNTNRLLLVLEDLHWAAESTLELLHYLVRKVCQSGKPILIAGSYRPEFLGEQHLLMEFQRQLEIDGLAFSIQLSPLSLTNVEQLIYKLSGEVEAIIPLAKKLHQETEGNPFFLVETIKALFETGEMSLVDGAWQGKFDRASRRDIPLPKSVSKVIQSRVNRLDKASQEALRIASIIGREFDFELLTHVTQ